MYCWKCGTENKDGARFCGNCGAELQTAPTQVSAPTPTPAESGTTALERVAKICRNPMLVILTALQSIMALWLLVTFFKSFDSTLESLEYVLKSNVSAELTVRVLTSFLGSLVLMIASVVLSVGGWQMIAGNAKKNDLILGGCNVVRTGFWLADGGLTLMCVSLVLTYVEPIRYYDELNMTDNMTGAVIALMATVGVVVYLGCMYSSLAALTMKLHGNIRDLAAGGDPACVRTGGVGTSVLYGIACGILLLITVCNPGEQINDDMRAMFLLLIGMYLLVCILAACFNGEMKAIRSAFANR